MAQSTLSALQPVNLVYADATGSFRVLLTIAQQQGLFEKHGLEIHAVAASGPIVPRVTKDVPIGLIGEPAAILQAAEGSDLRIVASFSRTRLSGHLVGRPDIQSASELRGRRFGVRVLGVGIWISTVLALEQLGLSPSRDEITLVPVGSPVEILRALEEGAIDAALLPLICPTCQVFAQSASPPAAACYLAWGCFQYFWWGAIAAWRREIRLEAAHSGGPARGVQRRARSRLRGRAVPAGGLVRPARCSRSGLIIER
jgi:hypothetical protein